MTKLRRKILASAILAVGFMAVPGIANAATSRMCNVDQVGVMANRIHIKCAPNPGQAYTKDIPYYAMRLNEPEAKIDNIIALAIASKQIRKPLVVWFDQSDYKSLPGCLGSNCRRLVAAALE